MVQFDGKLSGAAEKHFIRLSQKLGRNLLLAAEAITLPFIVYFSIKTEIWLLIVLYVILVIATPLLTQIPKRKKEGIAVTPKRIYTKGEYIVCVADRYEEYRKICDVKQVHDYGEFYTLVFPFGKISDKFICQKDLLAKGSLEEFEDLFAEKVIRHRKIEDD